MAASGTGGTIGGVADYLKSKRRSVRCVLADPPGSSLYSYIRTGTLQATGSGSITEGIGIGRITANLKDAPIDDAVHIEDADTVRYVYRLLHEEGLFLGSTSGINVAAAVRVARELGPRAHHRHGAVRRRREIPVAPVQPRLARAEGPGRLRPAAAGRRARAAARVPGRLTNIAAAPAGLAAAAAAVRECGGGKRYTHSIP